MKIILVEDDKLLGKLIHDYLITESEKVDLVNTGMNIRDKLDQESYDILILDVMLPDKNGIEICRELRSANVNIPILFISALNNQIDKIKAFESGADDYITKPFDFSELLARIKALVKREKSIKSTTLIWQNLVMILEEKQVKYKDNDLHLTPTEFKILEILLTTPLRVFKIDNIIQQLWDIDTIPTNNTLRTHIKSLRKKLANVGLDKDFIETVYGMGYRLKSVQKKSPKNVDKKPSLLTNNNQEEKKSSLLKSSKEAKLELLIKEMWLENKDNISQNCQQLLDFILGNNNIDIDKAIIISHNFVGFLGSIGYINASNISKQIENLLKDNYVNYQDKKITVKITNLIHELQKDLFPEGIPIQSRKKQKILNNKETIDILVIDEDQQLVNKLIMFIEDPNISLSFCHSISSAIKYLKEKIYDLVILENKWKKTLGKETCILNLLTEKKDDTKIIIYSADDSLANRLYCSKYSINAFLSKTNSLEILWENIQSALAQNNYNSIVNPLHNILIIDDDERFTAVLKQKLIINQLPVNINIISESVIFLDEIKKIKPQLIILDLEMPKLNGLDICKIIKKDSLLRSIPIIFLTSNLASDTITQLLEAGADDFISKSKIDLELYPRILTHLNQYANSI